MPAFQTALALINTGFSKDNIKGVAPSANLFAPGKPLSGGLKLFVDPQSALHNLLVPYLDALPQSIQESLRSTFYYALSSNPPVQVTSAWAPGYDNELTIWQAPDTAATKGGITVLLKTRYPGDPHPVPNRKAPPRPQKR
jgi:hypothetical protein